jgi:hypothetical protein
MLALTPAAKIHLLSFQTKRLPLNQALVSKYINDWLSRACLPYRITPYSSGEPPVTAWVVRSDSLPASLESQARPHLSNQKLPAVSQPGQTGRLKYQAHMKRAALAGIGLLQRATTTLAIRYPQTATTSQSGDHRPDCQEASNRHAAMRCCRSDSTAEQQGVIAVDRNPKQSQRRDNNRCVLIHCPARVDHQSDIDRLAHHAIATALQPQRSPADSGQVADRQHDQLVPRRITVPTPSLRMSEAD